VTDVTDTTDVTDVPADTDADHGDDHKVHYTDKGKKRADSEARRSWNYVCDFAGCGQRFNRPCRLETHMRTHTKERPFACDHQGCDKTFPRKDHLQRHLAHHHAEPARNHVCDWQGCGKTFTSNGRLQRHKEVHQSKFYCTGYSPCNEAFRKQETLDAHVKTVHMATKAYPCTFVDPSGVQCTRGYQTENSLRRHLATMHGEKEENRYLCMLCAAPGIERELNQDPTDGTMVGEPLSFATATELKAHEKEVHPPICSVCSQVFKNKCTLDSHFRALHTIPSDQELFPCPYYDCGKIFNRRGNLNTHVIQVHESLYRFACTPDVMQTSKHPDLSSWNGGNACGKEVKSKAALEQHIRTHHLGLPNRKDTRKAAKARKRLIPDRTPLTMLTGVGYEEARPIVCLAEGCPYRFVRDRDLKRHMAAEHGHPDDDADSDFLELELDAADGRQFWIGGLDEFDPMSMAGSIDPSLPQTPLPYFGEQAMDMDVPGGAAKANEILQPAPMDANMFDMDVDLADYSNGEDPQARYVADFLASVQEYNDRMPN
jgi:hypothetical protein